MNVRADVIQKSLQACEASKGRVVSLKGEFTFLAKETAKMEREDDLETGTNSAHHLAHYSGNASTIHEREIF